VDARPPSGLREHRRGVGRRAQGLGLGRRRNKNAVELPISSSPSPSSSHGHRHTPRSRKRKRKKYPVHSCIWYLVSGIWITIAPISPRTVCLFGSVAQTAPPRSYQRQPLLVLVLAPLNFVSFRLVGLRCSFPRRRRGDTGTFHDKV
jgi:hypothetical protein